MMSTVTVTLLTLFSRTPCSATPTGTVARMADFAPPTQTGSVMASVTWRRALSGPITSTVLGWDVASPAMYPVSGSPSTEGCTRTTRVADGSNRIATADGITCVTSTANGTRTRSGEI